MMKKIIFLFAVLALITKAYGQHFLPPFCCSNELFYISLEGGYQKLYIPKYSYGFLGGLFEPPSSSAFTAGDNPSGGYIAPSLGFRIPFKCQHFLIPDDLCVALSGNFFDVTEKSSGRLSLPVDLFIQYPFGPTAVLPSTSYSGVVITDEFTRKFEYNTGRVDFSVRYLFHINNCPVILEPIFFSYVRNYLRTTYDLQTLVVDFGDTISINQKLTTNYDDFGGGISILLPVWRRINIFATNILYGSNAHSRLKTSFESNQFAPIRLSEEKNNVSLTYRATLGLMTQIRCFHFGVKSSYEYRDYVPAIFNPSVDIVPGLPLNFPLIEKRSFSTFSVGGYVGINL